MVSLSGQNFSRRWIFIFAAISVAAAMTVRLDDVRVVRAEEKLKFDAVSIRATSGGQVNVLTVDSHNTNVDLTSDNTFLPTGGLFLVKGASLDVLIKFSYPELLPSQYNFLHKQLPAWARWPGGDGWTVQARANGNPSKNEYREMVKSLLVDRFGVVAHFETRNMPAYALVLDKPGVLGASLKHHSGNVPCENVTTTQPAQFSVTVPTIDGTFPVTCNVVARVKDLPEGRLVAGRDVSMKNIAEGLWVVSHAGPTVTLDRPIIDETGLAGRYDVTMEFAVGRGINDGSEPTFLQAMKEQLGLHLKETTAPVKVLVIDHINRQPTEN